MQKGEHNIYLHKTYLCHCRFNNNNEYLEHLTRTGPKRLHVLYRYIFVKIQCIQHESMHTCTHTQTCTCTHMRTCTHTQICINEKVSNVCITVISTHRHIHTRKHTRMHTHKHTHTHTHTYMEIILRKCSDCIRFLTASKTKLKQQQNVRLNALSTCKNSKWKLCFTSETQLQHYEVTDMIHCWSINSICVTP